MRVLDREGASREIREEEILYFSNHQNTIFVHTREGEFILPITLSDLLVAYRDQGFDRLDRSNVVNLPNVDSYDSERRIVSFTNAASYATVSEVNDKKIKRYLSRREEERPKG